MPINMSEIRFNVWKHKNNFILFDMSFLFVIFKQIKNNKLLKNKKMRNLILMLSILAMVSCGSSEKECTNHETDGTIVITANTEETTEGDTLDVTEIETVGELLDTLESIPSITVTK